VSFQTVEIHLSYAASLEKLGRKAEADEEMKECLQRFEKTNKASKAGENDSSRVDRSLAKSVEANILQKIGIRFRERKDYERSCDLLEKVLDVRKRMHTKLTSEAGYSVASNADLFTGKEFASLYNDLALTYQGMDDLNTAQEYLILAIQSYEKMQAPTPDKPLTEEEQLSSLQELADNYLFLADLLRK
jgi:tetratricopeptide (TPR) repeat protein